LTRRTERAAFRASKELKQQSELRVRQREEEILREIADAFDTARSTRERAHVAEQTVGLAAAALGAEERKLAAGRSSIFFVLQLQNEHLAAQSSELRAKADHLQAVSQLGYADGSLLNRFDLVAAGDSGAK
jgi:outer membrane protein TolC